MPEWGSFEKELRNRLNRLEPVEKSVLLEAAASLDHPALEELQLNESVDGEAAVAFLDIRGYTRLAMALEADEVARIMHAVLGAAIVDLHDHYGAHINDFTGDGIMAIFGGPGETLETAHPKAIYGASNLMRAMQATLREELLKSGIDDPVQVALGIVSGPVLWARIGTEEVSRVMVLGEVAPLAAKYVSGEETKAWEIMIGGEIGEAVDDSHKERRPDFVRVHKKEEHRRKRWLLNWEGLDEFAEPSAARRVFSTAGAGFASLVGDIEKPPRFKGGHGRREDTVG